MIVLLQFSEDPELADKLWNLLDEHCPDYGISLPNGFFVDGVPFTPAEVNNG